MGAVAPFVLWFNTAAGVFYVAIGVGLWAGRVWAFPLALGVLAVNLLVFAAFGLHVARGGDDSALRRACRGRPSGTSRAKRAIDAIRKRTAVEIGNEGSFGAGQPRFQTAV